jgi:hypothetical protein
MVPERNSGPAGDVDYEVHGEGYALQRQSDPRIAALIHEALGSARTVLNVGAGSGSYEPEDCYVVAVEPSAAMRAQRAPHRPAIDAVAESLPFDDGAFDAAMAIITVHQWSDVDRGLAELSRVARSVIVVTFDGTALDRFWLADYSPELIAAERRRYPEIQHIASKLGDGASVQVIPIPIDCTDGFTEAYYARPECFLDPRVRRSQSAWTFVDANRVTESIAKLDSDLRSGAWESRYAEWRRMPVFEGSLRLIVSHNTRSSA